MFNFSENITAFLLGLVEGLTEFLPVSSTGHLILAGHLLNFEGERAATFEIFIQLGAIFAVVLLYYKRFLGLFKAPSADVAASQGFTGRRGMMLLALGCAPAFIVGALAHKAVKAYLFGPTPVAVALIAGGLLMLFAERRYRASGTTSIDLLTGRQALLLGLFQCLSLWPGVSRSGSMMIGGLFLGLSRGAAAEFSFLVAVPVMCAATALDLIKSFHVLQPADFAMFAIGFFVSFVTAVIAIKGFLALLARITLRPFAYYRIALGVLVLYCMAR